MKVTLEVLTPEGKAEYVLKFLKRWIFVFNSIKKYECYSDKTHIYLMLEDEPRKINKVLKRVSTWDTMTKEILKAKTIKHFISEEDKAELEKLIKSDTRIRVVKVTEADKVQLNGKTFWENIKEKMQRINPF